MGGLACLRTMGRRFGGFARQRIRALVTRKAGSTWKDGEYAYLKGFSLADRQVRAAALAQAARTAAAQGMLGQIYGSGLGGDQRIAQAFLANGGSLSDLAQAGRIFDGLHNGIYGTVGDELANATNHNEGSAPAALRAASVSAVTAAMARAGAPVNYVMPDGSIYHGTAGAAPTGAQPLVSTDE